MMLVSSQIRNYMRFPYTATRPSMEENLHNTKYIQLTEFSSRPSQDPITSKSSRLSYIVILRTAMSPSQNSPRRVNPTRNFALVQMSCNENLVQGA